MDCVGCETDSEDFRKGVLTSSVGDVYSSCMALFVDTLTIIPSI
jgi:hypothetical protein